MSRDKANAAVAGLEEAANEAEELLDRGVDASHSKLQDARDRLMSAIESAKETCKKIEEKAVAGAKATDQAIRTHPYESMFVAFGLGLVVGLLLRRK
jgi:ElaB/YqjD/DUF883 family membrane-anchored ribosome-binding protein